MSDYHIPVLLKESIDALNIRDHGIYVDTTLGGGGHTRAILERNETITLVSFDRDEDAIKQTASLQKEFSERLISLPITTAASITSSLPSGNMSRSVRLPPNRF